MFKQSTRGASTSSVSGNSSPSSATSSPSASISDEPMCNMKFNNNHNSEQTASIRPHHSPRRLEDIMKSEEPKQLHLVGKTERKILVSLLYRKSSEDKSVLYMEAGKDFVDLLMSFLTLPIGSVLKLLDDSKQEPAQGAIYNIYQSIKLLDQSLFYVDKQPFIDPKHVTAEDLATEVFPSSEPRDRVYYKCSNHGCLRFVIDLPGQICPVCKFAMSHKLEVIEKGSAYPPPSPSPRRRDRIGIKSVLLLAKLQLDSLKDLDSIQMEINVREILELLKASLSSQTALNDVFESRIKDRLR